MEVQIRKEFRIVVVNEDESKSEYSVSVQEVVSDKYIVIEKDGGDSVWIDYAAKQQLIDAISAL